MLLLYKKYYWVRLDKMSEDNWTVVTKKNVKKEKEPRERSISSRHTNQYNTMNNTNTTTNYSKYNSQHIGPSNSKKIEERSEEGDYQIQKVSRDFQLKLQRARQDKHLTQKQLASLCNLQESVIRNYEQGNAIPNYKEINKIGQVLGVSLGK